MIACREAVDRLWTYLDRSLDRSREAELEQHLGLCRHCCGELEFAKQVRGKLKESGEAQLAPDAKERLATFVARLGAK